MRVLCRVAIATLHRGARMRMRAHIIEIESLGSFEALIRGHAKYIGIGSLSGELELGSGSGALGAISRIWLAVVRQTVVLAWPTLVKISNMVRPR